MFFLGEEYRAVFITTVRTANTCKPLEDAVRSTDPDAKLYFEFLSDPKLMNTAITRAKSLVAVVGDPVSLCTVGDCQTLWKDYIKRCSEKGGLFGTTMSQLESDIQSSFNKVQLNPEAPAFMPANTVETPDVPSNCTQDELHVDALEQYGHASSDILEPYAEQSK